MMRQLPWFLLALSGLFNVFFLAGYTKGRAQAGRNAEEAAEVSRAVASELGLDEGQRDLFAALQASMREELAVWNEALSSCRGDLMKELDSEVTDVDRIHELLLRQADLHEQRRLAAADRFSEFVEALTPQQRRRLVARLHYLGEGGPGGPGPWHGGRGGRDGHEGRRRHDGPRPPRFETFDLNGDGTLDQGERERAEVAIRQMRREREERRQEMLRRFDDNGDGTLDEQERDAMRQWRRERPKGGEDGGPADGPGGHSAPRTGH